MADRKLIDECVHCGFCLPACPTYQSTGRETESPRGRIYLMRAHAESGRPWSGSSVESLDRCVGCLACVSACPSGVKYDVLIEQTRSEIEREHTRSRGDSQLRELLFRVLPYPRRLRAGLFVAWVLQSLGVRWFVRWLLRKLTTAPARGVHSRLWQRLRALESLLPAVSPRQVLGRLPARSGAEGTCRARVVLLAGCVQSACFSRVNQATMSVLTAEGCEVTVPPGLGCCGALSLHAGRHDEAQALVKQAIVELEKCEFDALVVSSAGCGSAMKHWSRLLSGQPEWVERARKLESKVRDVSEWLVQLGPRAPRRRLGLRVAYHDACHLGHGQGVRAEPRQLLAGIDGLTLLEIPDADQCCGSGGVYNLLEPEAAELIGARKVEQVLSIQPEVIVSANPGCTLQLQRGLKQRGVDIEILHPAELLARALGPAPVLAPEAASGAAAPRAQSGRQSETEGRQAW